MKNKAFAFLLLVNFAFTCTCFLFFGNGCSPREEYISELEKANEEHTLYDYRKVLNRKNLTDHFGRIWTEIYEGHKYVIVYADRGIGACHSASCPCTTNILNRTN